MIFFFAKFILTRRHQLPLHIPVPHMMEALIAYYTICENSSHLTCFQTSKNSVTERKVSFEPKTCYKTKSCFQTENYGNFDILIPVLKYY